MAIALQNQFERLRFRLRAGPLGQFLKWWIGELRDLLPDAWRKRLVQAKRSLFLELTYSNIVASIFEAGSMHEIGLFSLVEDPLLHKQKLREVLIERELLEAPRELMLSEQDVLRREVVLPLAAEAGMRQALAYEMDRQTPYRVEDVYFAFRTVRRDRDASQVRV
jgi:general secretion pathway protein L